MMTTLNDRAARGFADRLANAAAADGLSPIAGRLFATFLLSDHPQSLDALAATLGVSKASVSTEARHLFERGIVERVSVAGDRRDYYELAPDFFAQVIRARVARWRRIQRLVADMRESSPALSAAVRDRFASIDDIHDAVVPEIEAALDRWERATRAKPGSKTSSRRRRTA
jgi:DNA-binding transcriptional regulator GbsR (MarR family)